ncbi:UNVERIFIED_CONTAM: hypothetical protein H355_009167 [Colinus virginianus]|nr:hypothetical protein H355_009167 [Colinus virginianus]
MGSPPGWRHHEGARRVKRAWVIPPISISENHKRIPHLLVQIKSDKQQPGGVIYSIKGPGVDEEPLGIFSIDKFSGKVFLNATLDREQNDRFRLKAFALDLGGATLEDPTDLEIIVVDQNDNRPLFSSDVFTGHIVEGAAPGTCVLTVEATDADDPETDNAALRFSILEQGHGDMFRINATTGEICTARGGLDREAVGVYNLTLQAADMSGDGLTTTATAVIHLDDINDNAPEFTKEEVLRMAVGVRWGCEPLDHEVRDRFQLTVSVQNQRPLEPGTASSPRAVATVRVRVRDVNEAPVFRENPRRVTVLEGTPPGTAVTTYTASDPDTRRLQTLTYALLYDPAGWLQLDPRSGTVRTQRELRDPAAFLQGGWYIALLLARDDAPSPLPQAVGVYNLTLQAADMSGDGLTTTATAVIHLDDINDNAPEFTKEEFSMEVEEQAGGAEVGRLLVHDKDLAGSPNWAAKFTILEGDPEGAFAIHTDPHTNDGVLTVAKPLDHEVRDRFQLTVSVQNQRPLEPGTASSPRAVATGSCPPPPLLSYPLPTSPELPADPPLSATGTLSIEIVEVNDHAPQLLPPSGAVCGRPGRGGAVLLGASDRDRPPHGAPFHFQLSPRHPQLARNWSITRFNDPPDPRTRTPPNLTDPLINPLPNRRPSRTPTTSASPTDPGPITRTSVTTLERSPAAGSA